MLQKKCITSATFLKLHRNLLENMVKVAPNLLEFNFIYYVSIGVLDYLAPQLTLTFHY